MALGKWARSVAAVVAGYAAVVLITSLTFTTILGGFRYHGSSTAERAIAAGGAMLAGFTGGFLAAWVAGRRPLAHAAAVLIPLAIDTSYVLLVWRTRQAVPDPVWFDLAGSATLMLTALAGGLVRAASRPRRVAAPEAAT